MQKDETRQEIGLEKFNFSKLGKYCIMWKNCKEIKERNKGDVKKVTIGVG